MKYVMVDKTDSVVSRVELDSNVGITGAKTYFVGIKKLSEKEFDKIWKVMTEEEYNIQFEVGHRKPSSHPGYIKWWKEERTNLDIDKD